VTTTLAWTYRRAERWVIAAWSCPAPGCVLAVFWDLVERPARPEPPPARCPCCGATARFLGWPGELKDIARMLGERARR
jgi:hypothetical protein